MISTKSALIFGCAALSLALAPHTALAQSVTSGTIVTGSDVVGGFFSPAGTVAAEASPAVAIATATAGTTITTSLSAGSLTAVGGGAIAPAAQSLILAIVSGGGGAVGTLAAALGASGVSVEATALAESMSNLINSPGTGQLSTAVGHYNAMVQAADANFISNPPAEFLAVQAVLAALVTAAAGAQ